jgi:hypothetical protein
MGPLRLFHISLCFISLFMPLRYVEIRDKKVRWQDLLDYDWLPDWHGVECVVMFFLCHSQPEHRVVETRAFTAESRRFRHNHCILQFYL